MALHKRKDGFVLDDDFGRVMIIYSRRYITAFIMFMCT